MKSFLKWVSAMAAVALLAGPTLAGEALASGKIESVNADKKEFVLTAADGKNNTFALGEDYLINRAGKEGKFSELKDGDDVSVLYDKGVLTWTAEYILVHEGDHKKCELGQGNLKSWDADKKRLTLTGFDNKDYTFEVGGSSQVQLGGKPSAVDELKLGDRATVIFLRDGDKMTIMQMVTTRK